MTLSSSSIDSLRRLFQTGFSARDIAEPLVSFDRSTDAGEVRDFMRQRKLRVVGVRVDGLVAGTLDEAALDGEPDGEQSDSLPLQPFDGERVIPGSTPLADVVAKLDEFPHLFVNILGNVGGIITRTDLQKPPVRMWLFGIVTLIEMRMMTMIQDFSGDEDWRQFLSAGRLKKAEDLLAERRRRNQDLELFDCLQFSDKGQIIARSQRLRSLTRYESRTRLDEAVKNLERLRNHLAHAQDIITLDWQTILELSTGLDVLLEGPPGLRETTDPQNNTE